MQEENEVENDFWDVHDGFDILTTIRVPNNLLYPKNPEHFCQGANSKDSMYLLQSADSKNWDQVRFESQSADVEGPDFYRVKCFNALSRYCWSKEAQDEVDEKYYVNYYVQDIFFGTLLLRNEGKLKRYNKAIINGQNEHKDVPNGLEVRVVGHDVLLRYLVSANSLE